MVKVIQDESESQKEKWKSVHITGLVSDSCTVYLFPCLWNRNQPFGFLRRSHIAKFGLANSVSE